MASAQNNSSVIKTTTVRAGLVYQAMGLNEHLRVALGEAGVHVIAESLADQLANSQLSQSQIDVFVVNLDPELEDHLDELTELLDRMDRPVIFNDGAASAGLAGWDQARWARHLASKIKGELNAHPPRPEGAEAVPVAKPKAAAPIAKAPVVDIAIVQAPVVAVAAATEVAPTIAAAVLEKPVETDPFAEMSEINLDFDEAPPQSFASKDESTVMDDFDASAFDLPDVRIAEETHLHDLDALLASAPKPEKTQVTASFVSATPQTHVAPTVELPILTPQQLDSAKLDSSSSLDWVLEPLEGEAPAAPVATSGRASFTAKDVAPAPAISAPVMPPTQAVPPPIANADAEADLGDLDFFADLEVQAPPAESLPLRNAAITKQQAIVPEVPAALDDLSAMFEDFSIPETTGAPAAAAPTAVSSDLDFDLDFEVGAPTQAAAPAAHSSKDEFADLDALFADSPSAAAPVSRVSVSAQDHHSTGPERVMVLGASIGGPEAVRSFLGKLKPNTPVAFLLAQHMGAEFLELMTSQLAKASAIPVRLAQPGDSFKPGEVLVVPVSQRMQIDNASVVQFSTLPNESPYSPSIDQVLFDMADRFGTRCSAIIFSGMASDAIEGAKYLASKGGKIWVQDPGTCVISSMIDGAQAAGIVSFVGAPEQLAEHLLSTVH